MKGWRSGLTIVAGVVFILAGAGVSLILNTSDAPSWIVILVITFCCGGIAIAAFGVYAQRAGIRYAMEVRDHAIRWGRADIQKEIGSIDLRDIREIVHTGEPDEDSLCAIDSAGVSHTIPLAYLKEAGDALRLLRYIETTYPTIKTKSRTRR